MNSRSTEKQRLMTKRLIVLIVAAAGLPADILTFLFWFDKKAAGYVR